MNRGRTQDPGRSCGVAIMGVGAVTPLGVDSGRTWQALIAGEAIRDTGRAPCPPPPEGEPRVTQLARRAAAEAICHAGWTAADVADDTTALVVGTSKGAADEWLVSSNVAAVTSDNPAGGVHLEIYGIAHVATRLARELELGGPALTLCGACASGLHALARACMLLAAGQADRVLVVAAESSLHPLFTGCFRQLGVLTDAGTPCRPFDANRHGFILSEAAAAVCLEASDRRLQPPATGSPRRLPIAWVDRFALGGDATHLTSGDPTSATLRRLLDQTLAGRPVDLIHAHGTGTLVNDSLELAAFDDAMQRLGAHASVYSHKGALGHSLGASGLLSVVLNVLMHAKGLIPPNVSTTTPMPTSPHLILAARASKRAVRRSIALASGFGGATAVVSLLAPDETP